MIKNSFVLFLSIIIGLCLGELLTRYFWVPNGINISRTAFSPRGYLLNPNDGTGFQKMDKQTILCHYYPPHLRETPNTHQGKNILVLGDSFTFGWLLPWQETYVYRLQTRIDQQFGKNHYHFLNAAVGGWGLADYLAYLEEYGEETSPRYVLIFLNTDDLGRAIKRNIYRLSDDKTLTPNYHPLRMVKLREFLFNNWLYEHSALFQFIRNNLSLAHLAQSKALKANAAYTDRIIPLSSDLEFQDDYAQRYGEALFLAINQWCQQHHAKLLVVTTGFNAFYPETLRDPTKLFLTHASVFFKNEQIAYYDMAMPFKKNVAGKNFQIPKDGHPNTVGTNAIANLSWPWIKQQIEWGQAHEK